MWHLGCGVMFLGPLGSCGYYPIRSLIYHVGAELGSYSFFRFLESCSFIFVVNHMEERNRSTFEDVEYTRTQLLVIISSSLYQWSYALHLIDSDFIESFSHYT